eukprot:6213247-Pleurochrysis_carterae.AAC.7
MHIVCKLCALHFSDEQSPHNTGPMREMLRPENGQSQNGHHRHAAKLIMLERNTVESPVRAIAE